MRPKKIQNKSNPTRLCILMPVTGSNQTKMKTVEKHNHVSSLT